MKVTKLSALLVSTAILAAAVVARPDRDEDDQPAVLQAGTIVSKVVVTANPEQSYALYLPSRYSPEQRWPIVYAFDPAARGTVPTELMKQGAEQYGYIVASSNNSHNGPFKPDADAAQAMWSDTHRRLAIDDARVYFAGFSGGARVAARMAQLCKCTSGVFLSGAGFPTDSPPSRSAVFPVFLTAGLADFNYGELVEVNAQLEALGTPHFLRRFDGQHQWAPAPIWQEAFAWADLLSMKEKHMARDDAFVAARMKTFREQAKAFEDGGDPYFAWQWLRESAAAFGGLVDISPLGEPALALEKSPGLAAGRKREKEDIAEQHALENQALGMLTQLKDEVTTRREIREQAGAAVERLKDRAHDERNPQRKRVLERARIGAFAFLIETGEPLMDQKDLALAKIYLELAAQARPELPWPHVSLARCSLKMGNKKEALESLRRAKEAGLGREDLADLPARYPEFAVLKSDPAYQKLVADRASVAPGPR